MSSSLGVEGTWHCRLVALGGRALALEQVFTATLGCCGMKTATMRASSTEHAPNRNGGPGITGFWKQKGGALYRRATVSL